MESFKVGELVKYDGGGVPLMARVEGRDGRRWRLLMLVDASRLSVAAGDISHLGEDARMAAREKSARDWATGGFNPESRQSTDGQGNFRTFPAPTDTDGGDWRE